MNINKITTNEEIKKLAILANEIWHEYFVCILSDEQIDYMVEKFQSYDSMKSQIEKSYEYYFMQVEDNNIGYFCIKKEEKAMFLSKLYLKKEERGKGYASKAMDFIKKETKNQKLNKIYLTVNKYNEHTIKVYKSKGFKIKKEQVVDIGQGYVMDDYVMELNIN